MLTAEARERMEAALDFNPERPRVTLRRDDVHNALVSLARAENDAQESSGCIAPAASHKPWAQTAGEWLGIFLLLLFVAYLGWMAGAGRL